MSSLKKTKANQQNALRSCGPKTAEGKMVSSQNARKHGFYSTQVLLADEDRNEYLRLARGVVAHHSPVGTLEAELVNMIIQTLWQLRRANIVDTELFQMYRFYENEERGVGTAFAHDASQGNAFSKLVRYQSHFLRKLSLLKKDLSELQSHRSLNVVGAAPSTSPPAALQSTLSPSVETLR